MQCCNGITVRHICTAYIRNVCCMASYSIGAIGIHFCFCMFCSVCSTIKPNLFPAELICCNTHSTLQVKIHWTHFLFALFLLLFVCLFFFNFLLLWWCIWLHHRLGRNYVKTTSRYIEPTNEYFVFVSSDNVWRIRGWFLFHLSPRTHIHSIDSLMRINHNKISSLAGAAMLLARYATMFIWGNPT